MKHFGMKRTAALFLALVLLMALAAPALAADYTDIAENYWGKPYIDELSARGLFSGYEDGSFRPNGKITFCETLVLFSRLYPVSEELRAYVDADYAEFVTETVPANLTWASKELCVCLAAGIISKNEMSRVNLGAQINKQTFALLLVRALGMRGEIKAHMETPLPLTDADKLISDYRGSVSILYDLGVVTGDENNAFNPTETVSRVIAAAMLSRALIYADKEGLELRISAYDKVEDSFSGLLLSIDGSTMLLEQNNGLVREVSFDARTGFTMNGGLILATEAVPGAYARLTVQEGVARSVELNLLAGQVYLSGQVDSVIVGGGGYLGILRSDTGTVGLFPLASGAVIVRNGAECSLSELQKEDRVILNLRDDQITEVAAFRSSDTMRGEVLSLLLGSPTVLRVEDALGRTWVFSLDEKALPEALLDGQVISFRQLRPGQTVTLELESGRLTRVLAGEASDTPAEPAEPVTPPAESAETLDGVLTAVIQSVSGNYWELTDAKGAVRRLSLADSVTATRGEERVALSEIKVGDSLRVTVVKDAITAIQLTPPAAAPQLTRTAGKLLSVDAAGKTLTLLADAKALTVTLPTGALILNAANSAVLSLGDLSANFQLAVYGYEQEGGFTATLIVVEQAAS